MHWKMTISQDSVLYHKCTNAETQIVKTWKRKRWEKWNKFVLVL